MSENKESEGKEEWKDSYYESSGDKNVWIEPNERDLNGKSRIPEKSKADEKLLQSNPNTSQLSFREMQLRLNFKEDWWDDCINRNQLYAAVTTFGPEKGKYHMYYPVPAFKLWASADNPKYLVQYMENIVKPKNPYVCFLGYIIKTTTGIIQLPALTSGSSVEDKVNKGLSEYLEKHLSEQLKDFSAVESAKQRAIAESGRKKKAITQFNKDLIDHRSNILDNAEYHKNWFFQNIPEAKPREPLEWAELDVLANYRGFETEKFVPKMNTLTFTQLPEYFKKEEITDAKVPSNIKFDYARRLLPDGRWLLVRITKVAKT